MTSMRIIAPYWADAITRSSGNIYYRTFNTSEQSLELQQIISSYFNISKLESMQVFVATYDEVPEYKSPICRCSDSSIVSNPFFSFSFLLINLFI